MYYKNVVSRSCVRLLMLGVIGLMYYGNLSADTETLNPVSDSETSLKVSPASHPDDHWATVDNDFSTPDEDAFVYKTIGTSGQDLYNLSNHTTDGTGTITSVEVFAKVKLTDGTSTGEELKICIRPDGTDPAYYNSTTYTLSNSYADYSFEWTDNLSTSAAWTWADIDVLQAGISLQGGTDGHTFCTQVYVVVTYTPSPNPTAPTSLLCEQQTNPVDVEDTDPEFSAIYNDPTADDVANKYRIQVSTDNSFTSTFHWNSNASGITIPNVTPPGTRCLPDIIYGGSALDEGIKYYWRIKFWDDEGNEGAWSPSGAEAAWFEMAVMPDVYYVRQSCGNDDWTGLYNTPQGDPATDGPWLTISKAADNMSVAGDIVYVGPGTYGEEVTINNSGTGGNLIHYIADPLGTHTGDTPGDVEVHGNSVTPPNDNVFYLPCHYIEINGFKITGDWDGIKATGCDGVVISNNDISTTHIGITGANTISDNTIHNNGGDGINAPESFATISNNTISSNSLCGIDVEIRSNISIFENTIHSNTEQGISGVGSNSIVSNNAIFSNTVGGIYVNDNATGVTISNNLIYSNTTCGIHSPGLNSTISNNTIYSHATGIYEYDDPDCNITISNNIITNNTTGIDVSPTTRPTLSYNYVWGNTMNYDNCSAGTGCIGDATNHPDPLFVNTDISKAPLDLHLKSYYDDEGGPNKGTCTGGGWGASPGGGTWTAYTDECSPCIDAGNPTDIYPLEPEPNADRINMGAFGNTIQASRNCEGYYAIELISFDARQEKDYILLNWITEAEINNYKWLISRSETKDAGYEQITELHAQGVPNSYIYLDSLITPGQSYWYKLGDVDKHGSITWHGPVSVKAGQSIKFSFSLKEPASNPSIGKVKLEYSIPGYQGGKLRPISLKIYNISGQVVKTLVDKRQKPGHYTIWWDGKNEQDKKVGSGTFFCHFKANGELTRKLIHIK